MQSMINYQNYQLLTIGGNENWVSISFDGAQDDRQWSSSSKWVWWISQFFSRLLYEGMITRDPYPSMLRLLSAQARSGRQVKSASCKMGIAGFSSLSFAQRVPRWEVSCRYFSWSFLREPVPQLRITSQRMGTLDGAPFDLTISFIWARSSRYVLFLSRDKICSHSRCN